MQKIQYHATQRRRLQPVHPAAPCTAAVCGAKKGLLANGFNIEQLIADSDFQQKIKCREALYKDNGLLEGFLKENPYNLSNEDMEIAAGFRHRLSGRFVVMKQLKEHAIFTDDKYAYGVLSLSTPLEIVMHFAPLPCMVEAVLLPFKGKIIYDGFLMPYNVRFGGGYKSSFNDQLKEAKAKYGIVTSLPFDGKEVWAGKNPSEQLAYFMESKANREEFDDKIQVLLKKHPALLPEYHQLWGAVHAAAYKRNLKGLGLQKAWYAVLEGHLISSAMDKAGLEKTVKSLVPKEKQGWVHLFKM